MMPTGGRILSASASTMSARSAGVILLRRAIATPSVFAACGLALAAGEARRRASPAASAKPQAAKTEGVAMARRNKITPADLADMVEALADKIRPPVGIILGSPREAADLAAALAPEPAVC